MNSAPHSSLGAAARAFGLFPLALLPAAFSPIVKVAGAAGLSVSFAYASLLSAFNVVRFVFSR